MPVYVQHEVLGRVADVFSAEAIWQAPGLALFSRRPLLRDLLERSPREQRGRAATRCFSHITLMLPQEEVDDDYHLSRGARAHDLAQTLTSLHQKDFGDLLGADQVRYHVRGSAALAPGQVEVRFGHAVYLPAPEEKILFNVSVSRDGANWQPVCPIYPNQRLAMLGADSDCPDWPFGDEGAVLIVNDGPDAAPLVQMRPKEAFDCRYDPRAGCYTIRSSRPPEQHGGARLLLKVARAGAARTAATTPMSAPAPAPSVWLPRAKPAAAMPEQTAIPLAPAMHGAEADATYAPVAQQRISLVALALPRLSRYRDTGATMLTLPFSRALALAADAEQAIRFELNAADELYACTEAGRQRVSLPLRFAPVDGRALALRAVPGPLQERYCALLTLAQPLSAPVAAGARFTFGRNAPVLAALRVLDSPRFLRCGATANSDTDGGSADRIGLSRKAFSFEAANGGFRIGRLSASQALYHLDAQLELVACIEQAEAEAPYFLPAGHHLVAGHYVLRFDA